MLHRAARAALTAAVIATLAGCGAGGSQTLNTQPSGNMASMALSLSDASSDDWATIGVRVLSIALVPQDGGAAVSVWSAPSPAPYINLEQLDQLGEILGNVSVPVGTYSGAILTVGANPGDLLLTVSSNPESGFPVAAGTSIPAAQIQIQGKQGSSGNLTVPVDVSFAAPLTVTATGSNALDLEFDLSDPAFIMGHTPPVADGTTFWAVNFKGPVRHRAMHDLARLVLRHSYGTVSSVASDNSSFTMSKDYPVLPVTSPETAITTMQALEIQADALNGTIFYDVDAKTRNVVKDFSAEAMGLSGKYVRVAARYQQDGKLVAVRVWASSDFDKVWLSPEGHVLHVDATSDVITVANESGGAVQVTIDDNTQFFFRTPANAQADATPIGTGTAFIAAQDLVRGFKVHVSVVDPLATPLVAQSVDIETAVYAGRISNAGTTAFSYTRQFLRASDDYSVSLNYLDAATPNGSDGSGNAITGFKWWNFTFPTLVTSGSSAVADFVSATDGAVNFGGSAGALAAYGVSAATWGDPANLSGWSARDAILMPTPVPLGLVSSPYANGAFAVSVLGGATPATVTVGTAMGSATLVYQIDRSGDVVTISPIDASSASGQATLTGNLVSGVPVKVFGIPQPDGTLKAYVLIYYTGMLPSM
ncbi:MAG TPA: DUF4382 domain-containing protein [Steroidobacteraceae bacterium]|nr:DUF4382 domain-containing protein [Steroidobacteraceae bacterium]